MLTSEQFRQTILAYYKKYSRDLPWRNTTDPYRIVVSEIMLQQTQVSRVLKKYPEFIAAFPNFSALARAPLSGVLKAWQGMGYNRRAIALSRIAQIVMKEYGGRLPKNPEVLEQMPGIGHYTARAVVCFSGGACEPFLETNIRRVLIYFFHPRGRNISDQTLLRRLEKAQPPKQQREWYLALMDYGAMLAQKGENPNRRSKQYHKQSKFEGSNRQLRGRVIKMLVEKGGVSEKELRTVHNSPQPSRSLDFARDRLLREGDWLEQILSTLQKEGFIIKRRSLYRLR